MNMLGHCVKPYISTSHSPFAVSATASSEDEKQWLSVCWNLSREVRAANPSQPALSAQRQKVRLRHSPAPPLAVCALYFLLLLVLLLSRSSQLGQGHRELASRGTLRIL